MKSYRVSVAVLNRIVDLCNQDPLRIGMEVNRLLRHAEELEMPYRTKMKLVPGKWPEPYTYDPEQRLIKLKEKPS